mmetsp:Transcript_52446/g.63193  ORF Transcript_52446/g.63193 Transcript_52446/m.63193 type:complete len:209 (-) Transcript_52446:299-925(-)|eukprot:CAMPEP_0172497400 /NCGR_PEP_ID=MMETSP1066-20121228/99353_1 /TAXON_ID=671091 /ORGANISM="Coscinodiscus wailesii, Strain CCMP2513" /LENGTH=208 /DNA_ID=CAMNT_0013270149 /DNA_START=68 /DNA_END=694 /DNA_ORIENTATION=+
MANFGELVLLMGDIHIPHRATDIPEKFKRMLVPNKMQHVICTGNLGSQEQYETLRNLAPNVAVVAGDFEYFTPSSSQTPAQQQLFPETKVVQVGQFRIGVIHGHQVIPWGDHMSLAMMRRKLDVDILVSGHTHKNEVHEHEGFWHINPGSITGAHSSMTADVTPSFILLAIQGPKVVCYVYELIDGEVDVSKTEFTKGESMSESLVLI